VRDVVTHGRLKWFSHIEKRPDDGWLKWCQNVEMEGKVGRSRDRKTWSECVRGDMKDMGLKAKMSKTDRCEERNFLIKHLSRASMIKQT